MIAIIFVASLLACYVLSYQIMHRLAVANQRSYFLFRLILLPGVVIHELAHVLACVITGTAIHEISFWDQQGGHVTHEKPKYALLTQPLISLAPLPVGVVSLFALNQLISPQNWLLSLIIILLMVSIAGTLAPSKADFVPALEGIVTLSVLIGLILYFIPESRGLLTTFFAHLVPTLRTVVLLLGGMWVCLVATQRITRH